MASERYPFNSAEYSDYPIVNGPNNLDLMFSLFHVDSYNRDKVTFKVNCIHDDVIVIIDSLRRQDPSGENWVFEGHEPQMLNVDCKGHYNSQRREGWIKLIQR